MLVDTNVLVDVLENDPDWADWSIAKLQAHSKVYRLAINPIIYSELSLTFSTVEALDQVLDSMELRMLEEVREQLEVDRLHAAAIEWGARVRHLRG